MCCVPGTKDTQNCSCIGELATFSHDYEPYGPSGCVAAVLEAMDFYTERAAEIRRWL